jgi:PAS domain-containing protein
MVDRRFSGQAAELFQTNERLQLEIKERDQIENELRAVRGELEQRVSERTAELSEANTLLKKEMSAREKAQDEIASLAKFPDENPHPIFRMTPDGRILYKNKSSLSLLDQGECWEDQKIKGWAYEAAQKALNQNQPVQIEVECGNRVFSVTFAPIRESDYINVYAFDITERRLAEEESHALMNNLGERVKELTALHQTARLVQDPNATPKEIVERLVELIPAAWRYPEITGAHVLYDSIEVTTPNFASTPWIQSAEFQTGDGKRGVIEVCYLAEKPKLDEGPFLIEERNLLNSLTEMLRTYFEAKRVTRDLEVRFQFENLITSISTKFINLPTAEFETGIIEALGAIGTFANVDRSYIYQFSGDSVWAYLTHEWDADGVPPAGEKFAVLPVDHFPWSIQQLLKGKPVHIPRISELPPEAIGEKEAARVGGIKSLIFVPMIRRKSLIGLMGFSSLRQEKYWEEDHVALLRIIGKRIMWPSSGLSVKSLPMPWTASTRMKNSNACGIGLFVNRKPCCQWHENRLRGWRPRYSR